MMLGSANLSLWQLACGVLFGGIGIPLFVHEDGRMTLELDEALAWLGQEPARAEELPESFCGIHGCG